VVDHFGDAGTAWRLCRELLGLSGKKIRVRLFIDDLNTLGSIIGVSLSSHEFREIQGIEILPWGLLDSDPAAELVVEMFGCDPPENYLINGATDISLIINLDYFSCEAWAVDCHLRESLLGRQGLRKFFFMPGLDPHSGGIMSTSRPNLPADKRLAKESWLKAQGLEPDLEAMGCILAYTYSCEFRPLLEYLSADKKPWLVWGMGNACRESLNEICGYQMRKTMVSGMPAYQKGNCTVLLPPFYPQPVFDALLALTELSLVRGEDSLCGALISGNPFLWQAYPQEQGVHRPKVESFLKSLDPIWSSESLAKLFRDSTMAFNHFDDGGPLDWEKIIIHLPDLRMDLSNFADSLRSICNLTEKLLQFSTLFFQGEIK